MAGNFTSAEAVAGTDILVTQQQALRDDILVNAGDYATSTGSANAYVLTISSDMPTYAAGQVIKFYANFQNSAAATIAVNGQAAKSIKKNHDVALESGDIEVGSLVKLMYDGTNFQMLSPTAIDISSANKVTLGAGATSNADLLHTHNPLAQDDALFAGGVIHLPVILADANTVLSTSYYGASRLWKRPGSISFMLDNTNSKAAIRTDGVDQMAGAGGQDGLFENSGGATINMSDTFTAKFKFRFGVVPASTDTFFIGFASSADTLDASFASPTTDTHIGYEWNGTNWRITNADATTQKTTSVATPAVGWHELKIIRIAATSIQFILDGTSLGTHTLNLPASGELTFYMTLANVSGTTRYVEVCRFVDMYIPTT